MQDWKRGGEASVTRVRKKEMLFIACLEIIYLSIKLAYFIGLVNWRMTRFSMPIVIWT